MSKERKNRVRISIFFPIPLKHGEKNDKKTSASAKGRACRGTTQNLKLKVSSDHC